jgi:hypothetical protein
VLANEVAQEEELIANTLQKRLDKVPTSTATKPRFLVAQPSSVLCQAWSRIDRSC